MQYNATPERSRDHLDGVVRRALLHAKVHWVALRDSAYSEAALYSYSDYNTVNYDRSGTVYFPIRHTCTLLYHLRLLNTLIKHLFFAIIVYGLFSSAPVQGWAAPPGWRCGISCPSSLPTHPDLCWPWSWARPGGCMAGANTAVPVLWTVPGRQVELVQHYTVYGKRASWNHATSRIYPCVFFCALVLAMFCYRMQAISPWIIPFTVVYISQLEHTSSLDVPNCPPHRLINHQLRLGTA